MRIISNDGHRASARPVRVIRLVSTADSRTERLRFLMTASNSRYSTHRIACTYYIQPSLMSASQFSKRRPRIVATQKHAAKKVVAAVSDRRNTVSEVRINPARYLAGRWNQMQLLNMKI